MSHDATINAQAAAAFAAVPASRAPRVVVGFDGFIDHIIDVVAKRASPTEYTELATIADFGARISAAAGKSANFELVVTQSKIGGNGPIMANALCAYGCTVQVVGLLGDAAIDPVFAPLAQRAEALITLGGPGVTDALEFSDGKLMLGKLTPLERMTWANLVKVVGLDKLKALLRDADAVATVNWTMLLGLTEIWEKLGSDVMPGLRKDRPLWFVDLADPAKRTLADQQRGLRALTTLQQHADVVLGMNEAELGQVLTALGKSWQDGGSEYEQARKGCEIVRDTLGLSFAMCHLVKSAACAWSANAARHVGHDGKPGSACAEGFFEPNPLITTGAGDHFNAGFVTALLTGLHPLQAIQVGGATSGHYVRTTMSPSRSDASSFLQRNARA